MAIEQVIHIERKKRIQGIVRVIIALLFLTLLITALDFNKILYALKNVNFWLIAAALMLAIPNLYVQYLKWKIICNSMLNEYSRRNIFLSLFYGLSAGAITPMRLGEYVGRKIALKKAGILRVTTATVIDKVFLLVITIGAGIISLIIFINIKYAISLTYLFVLYTVASIILIILSMLVLSPEKLLKPVLSFMSFQPRLKKIIDSKLVEGYSSLGRIDFTIRVKITLISLALYICMLLQYALLVSAFAHIWNPFMFFMVGSLVIFSKTIISFSFADLGIREGASVFFLTQMGLTAAAGFNASIFLFIINIFIPSGIGALLLMKGSK